VLAEFMGRANVRTTMIYVHAARKQKIEATVKLQACVEAAWDAKQLQEKQEAENLKSSEEEWGNPIYESEGKPPQNPPQEAEIENLPF
jgi:hypothetical protein